MKYLIQHYDPALRWDCQYKEWAEFDSEQEAHDYCKELFADEEYTLELKE